MSKINLLPWREELKKIHNRIFYSVLSGTIALSLVFIILADSVLNYKIKVENANIAYINRALRDVKTQVNEVQLLKANKKQLLERMNIIQLLQSDRTSVVKLLDAIPKLVPEGLYLTLLSRKELEAPKDLSENLDAPLSPDAKARAKKREAEASQKKYLVTVQGIALTNGSVSIFLKKLETVPGLSEIKLNEISINKDGNGLNFNLGFVQNLTEKE